MSATRQREAISALQLFLGTAEGAAAAWSAPLDPGTVARAAGQLHAAVRWLSAAIAILAAADAYPVLDGCQRRIQAAWRCTAALHAPECGQGDGSGHGDLLCAAARYTAGTWSQRRPGQGQPDTDLAGLAGITAALARAARALARQQPRTPAAASLSAASSHLDTASGLLQTAASHARCPAAAQRRRPRTAGRQQANQAPARQADS